MKTASAGLNRWNSLYNLLLFIKYCPFLLRAEAGRKFLILAIIFFGGSY
jgi:hypothetical protein